MDLLDFIGSVLGFGLSVVGNIAILLIRLVIMAIVAVIAGVKGYNAWIFVIGTLITPLPVSFLIIFLVSYLPKKFPKFPRNIGTHSAFEGKNPVIASIMALSAMIAKADGSVTKGEIRVIKDFISTHFGIGLQEINNYADCFEYGKQHPEEYLAFTEMIRGYYNTRRDYILALSYMFVEVAFKEGVDSSIKEAQTRKIIIALGLTEYEYQALYMAYMGQSQGCGQGYGYTGQQGFGGYSSQEDLVKKYTEVLGVTKDASMAEIKRAYRKLVKEYHPDKLAAGGVPPEYIEFANQKIRDINEAYEYLEKVKGGK